MTSPNLTNIEVGGSQCSKIPTSPIPHPSFQSPKQHVEVKETSPNHVFCIDTIEPDTKQPGTSLTCYERLDEDQSDNYFLNMPSVSTMKRTHCLVKVNIQITDHWVESM
jgi:hypothetical protein